MKSWTKGTAVLGCVGMTACGSMEGETSAPQQTVLRDASRSDDGAVSDSSSNTAPNVGRPAHPLRPIVHCVARGVDNQLVAYFGYENPHDGTLSIPIGPRNAFLPPPFDRGQPTSFAPGAMNSVVSVAFDARRGHLAWKLSGELAVASRNSPPCVPSFGGVTSASVLSDSEISLAWNAATDYTTSSSDIVYDICVSTTPGVCATTFVVAQTTAPGATSAIAAGLAANTQHYFVVRARNAVGRADGNGVEVGAQTCVTGNAACHGICTSLADDPANCGSCGDRCSNGTTCSAGQCIGSAPVVTAVALGGYHTCALLSGGTVACWGFNLSGQLGNGTLRDSSRPVAVSGLSGAVAVAAGYRHSCALLMDGRVACWGSNRAGELGDGTLTDALTPVLVSGVSGARAVSAGMSHSCALLTSGGVKCWGWNRYGQLGNGTTIDSVTSVEVSGLSEAETLNAGNAHACSILADGAVQCWGWNAHGQLGNGTTIDSAVPTNVLGLREVTAVVAGGISYHTCAVLTDMTLACWGNNDYGQLGDGTTTSTSTPLPIANLSRVAAVAVGGTHTCALLTDGTVVCWGWDSSGSFVTFPEVTGATNIVAGYRHTCALSASGTLKCWGLNDVGQLGNGTAAAIISGPVDVQW